MADIKKPATSVYTASELVTQKITVNPKIGQVKTEEQKKVEEKIAEQKAKKIKKSQKLPRYWKKKSCDRDHRLCLEVVEEYFNQYYNSINEEKWFAGRGNPIESEEDRKDKEEQKKKDIQNNTEEEIKGEVNPPQQPIIKSKIKCENDYWYTEISKFGSWQVDKDNWDDPNCWHKQRWEYITFHPNGPGFDVNGDEDKNDPYYNQSFVKGANLENELKSVEKDINSDFLNGVSNDLYKSEADLEAERSYKQSMTAASQDWEQYQKERNGMSFDQQAETITVSQNLQGIAHGLNNSLAVIDQVITPKLTTYILDYMTQELMSYTQQAMIEILSFDAREIVEMGMKLVPDYVKTPTELLKELLSDNESISTNEIEKAEEDLRNKFNEKLTYGAAGISNFATKELEKVNKELCIISYYSQFGPAWIDAKVKKAVSSSMDFSKKYIGSARDSLIHEKNKFVEKMSKNLAQRVATQQEKQLEVLTKEQIDEANQKKAEALSKAKTAIQQAKLVIFGLLGV